MHLRAVTKKAVGVKNKNYTGVLQTHTSVKYDNSDSLASSVKYTYVLCK